MKKRIGVTGGPVGRIPRAVLFPRRGFPTSTNKLNRLCVKPGIVRSSSSPVRNRGSRNFKNWPTCLSRLFCLTQATTTTEVNGGDSAMPGTASCTPPTEPAVVARPRLLKTKTGLAASPRKPKTAARPSPAPTGQPEATAKSPAPQKPLVTPQQVFAELVRSANLGDSICLAGLPRILEKKALGLANGRQHHRACGAGLG
jgi:cell division septation protein DedD